MATVKLFFKVPRHTPVDPNWNQKNIHSVSRVWTCRVSSELWCYLKSIKYFSMSKDLQGKQMAEQQISGALSPKAQKSQKGALIMTLSACCFWKTPTKCWPSPQHGKNCVIPFCSPSFRSFSGLIPPVRMDANIFLSQCLYFSLWMHPLHPTLDFHADNKETNCVDLKYRGRRGPCLIGLKWAAEQIALHSIQIIFDLKWPYFLTHSSLVWEDYFILSDSYCEDYIEFPS